MVEKLVILAATFVVMVVVFFIIEKWLKRRSKKLSLRDPQENPNCIYKARLKFYMPSGWYCEFWKGNVKCFGVVELPEEGHFVGERLEVKVAGFSSIYNLNLI